MWDCTLNANVSSESLAVPDGQPEMERRPRSTQSAALRSAASTRRRPRACRRYSSRRLHRSSTSNRSRWRGSRAAPPNFVNSSPHSGSCCRCSGGRPISARAVPCRCRGLSPPCDSPSWRRTAPRGDPTRRSRVPRRYHRARAAVAQRVERGDSRAQQRRSFYRGQFTRDRGQCFERDTCSPHTRRHTRCRELDRSNR